MGDLVFNDADKVNLLFKKTIGFASTQSTLQFNNESLKSFNIVFPDHVWSDIDQVPLVPPANMSDGDIHNGVLQYVDKLQLELVQGSGDKAYRHDDLVNIMPFSYGDYVNQVSVFTSTNAPLQFGNNGGDWIIDPAAGLLTFHSYDKVSNLVDANKLPKISFYKYVGNSGIGGNANTNGTFNNLTIASSLSVTNDSGLSGDLTVGGTSTFNGGVTISSTNNLDVGGNGDFSGDLNVGGNSTFVDVDLDKIYTNQINYKDTSYTLDYNQGIGQLLFDLDTSGILMRVGSTDSLTIHPTNGHISMFTNDDEYELNVLGTIGATHVLTNSDIRIKEDIKEMNTFECLENINKIKIKTFYFKEFWEKNRTKRKLNVGIIAQELREHFPDMVSIRKNNVIMKDTDGTNIVIDNFHDVDWEQIYRMSIGAIQELDKRLNTIVCDLLNIEKSITPQNEDIYKYIDNKFNELNDKLEGNILDICNHFYDEVNKKIFIIENKLLKKWVKYDITSDTDTDSESGTDSPDSNANSDHYMKYISREIHDNIININRAYINKQDEKINILGAQYEELAEQNRNLKRQINILDNNIQNIQNRVLNNNNSCMEVIYRFFR